MGIAYTGNVFVEIKQNYDLAFQWTKKSYDNGNLGALYNLAKFYEKGQGINTDKEQAFKYMKLSAESDAIGMFGLASYYDEGIGTNKNQEQASYRYKKFIDLYPDGFDKCTKNENILCYKQIAIKRANDLSESFNKPESLFYKDI